MNYIDWCREFFVKHPATVLGVGIGALLGLGFAVFGFWKTLVVAVCVGAGLFIGYRLDNGEGFADVREALRGITKKK